jgi:hypothetical protein
LYGSYLTFKISLA